MASPGWTVSPPNRPTATWATCPLCREAAVPLASAARATCPSSPSDPGGTARSGENLGGRGQERRLPAMGHVIVIWYMLYLRNRSGVVCDENLGSRVLDVNRKWNFSARFPGHSGSGLVLCSREWSQTSELERNYAPITGKMFQSRTWSSFSRQGSDSLFGFRSNSVMVYILVHDKNTNGYACV